LPPSDIVADTHVVQALGQPDGDYRQLATPTFVLRRGQLRRRYARELSMLDAGGGSAAEDPGRQGGRLIQSGSRSAAAGEKEEEAEPDGGRSPRPAWPGEVSDASLSPVIREAIVPERMGTPPSLPSVVSA
jgi:hypothetical protein